MDAPGRPVYIAAMFDLGHTLLARAERNPDADEKSLGNGWCFTGDTGNFDKDGDLAVTGRVDDRIITGGENEAEA